MANSNVYITLVIAKAMKVLNELKELKVIPQDYDPLHNHLFNDKVIGCSRFKNEIAVIDDVVKLIAETKRTEQVSFDDIIALTDKLREVDGETSLDENVELQGALVRGLGLDVCPLWCPGIGVIVYTDEPCGLLSIPEPIEGETYTLKMDHGCLQPFGRIVEHTEPVDHFTVALTLEQVGDRKALALASCYPGRPDSDDADREGLVEAGILTADEVRRRKLRPKQKKA